MSLQKLRGRLKTIKGLNSIFAALQVVTVVRAKKVRDVHSSLERYLAPMRQALAGRVKESALKKKVLVVITSNRGLCGAFNTMAVSKALEFAGKNTGVSLAVLGRVGVSQLKRSGFPIVISESEMVEKPSFDKSAKLFRRIFALGGEIHVAFNSYRSAVIQVPKLYRLYPAPEELIDQKASAEFILEPRASDLIDALFYHYLESRFFQLVMDSQMGELAARLMVLKGAVDTSRDMSTDLLLSINKARQAAITKDLLEIVSAAEALRSGDE